MRNNQRQYRGQSSEEWYGIVGPEDDLEPDEEFEEEELEEDEDE